MYKEAVEAQTDYSALADSEVGTHMQYAHMHRHTRTTHAHVHMRMSTCTAHAHKRMHPQ
jgi:hypothetical protein